MILNLLRYDYEKGTFGLLFIDGKFQCYILEPINCIPVGIYKLGLRKFGDHHNLYSKKFPDFHIGMIEILNVPGRKDILYHIGNRFKDTLGCQLPGTGTKKDYGVMNSKEAYINFYNKVAPNIQNCKLIIENK